jgi:hypothetical protein
LRSWLWQLVVLSLAVSAGCSMLPSGPTSQIVKAAGGHTLAAFVARYGPPNSDFQQTDNGERSFQWDHFGAGQPAPGPQVAGTPPSFSSNCRIVLSALPNDAGDPNTAYDSWIVKSGVAYSCP